MELHKENLFKNKDLLSRYFYGLIFGGPFRENEYIKIPVLDTLQREDFSPFYSWLLTNHVLFYAKSESTRKAIQDVIDLHNRAINRLNNKIEEHEWKCSWQAGYAAEESIKPGPHIDKLPYIVNKALEYAGQHKNNIINPFYQSITDKLADLVIQLFPAHNQYIDTIKFNFVTNNQKIIEFGYNKQDVDPFNIKITGQPATINLSYEEMVNLNKELGEFIKICGDLPDGVTPDPRKFVMYNRSKYRRVHFGEVLPTRLTYDEISENFYQVDGDNNKAYNKELPPAITLIETPIIKFDDNL